MMSAAKTNLNLAAIVSCGDELVTGKTVDTNSAWLSDQLGMLGVSAVRHVTVGDDAAATTAAIAESAELAGFVVVTGGLGPTPDDLTRDAVAGLFGEPLELRPESLAQVAEWFKRFNRPMAPANHVQAMAPASAAMIRNDWGTAPGLRFNWRGSECFCLPGVPREMKSMFAAAVAPAIRDRLGGDTALAARTIHTFGIGESDLATRLGDLLARGRNPQLGTTAGAGSVSVRIYARGENAAKTQAMLDSSTELVIERLGADLCFGQDEQSLESVIGDLLRAKRQTLSLAESCTGGLVGSMITAVPGSSDYFLESVVSYSNQAKIARLGVRPETLDQFGAVSEQVAAEMAAGSRRTSGADWAVSITGIAGPGVGTADKPVGLVYIGVAGPSSLEGSRLCATGGLSARAGDPLAGKPPVAHGSGGIGTVRVHRHVFPGEREIVRLRAARNALNALRLALRER